MCPKLKTRNILVTGCGSIGQRHIRNLLTLEAGRITAHDISEDRLSEVRNRFGVQTSSSWQEALEQDINVVFVCNPTSLHVSTALEALAAGSDVFIEKPLSHTADGLHQLLFEANQRQRRVFIACNFRFDSCMQKTLELIRQERLGRVFSASAEFGHFLPDWRPWQDYRQSYSGRSSLGGGILLDAYHEFDYLCWLFGSVERVFCQSHTASSLAIDTEDLALVTLRFSSGVYGHINLDYLRRPYRRSLQVVGEFGTLEWDFSGHSVRLFDSRERVWTNYMAGTSVEVNQMYLEEMQHFLACLEGREEPIDTLQDAVNVMRVILAAKESSRTGVAVPVCAVQMGPQPSPVLPRPEQSNLAPSAEDRPKIGAIIQARMGSTRLPGKSLIPIAGKPLLGHVIDRARMSRYIEEIVVATTTAPADSPIENFTREYGVRVFRGHPDDVLDRFYQAAKQFGITVVVRLTADDPFKDAREGDRVIAKLLEEHDRLDYVSNWLKPSYPEGLEFEAFHFEALERAWREAKLPSEREHVTPYIWMHPEIFRLANVEHSEDLSRLRWTLDTSADLEFTRQVYAELYHGTPFSMPELLELLRRRPELQTINSGTPRYAGFWTTWEADDRLTKAKGLP